MTANTPSIADLPPMLTPSQVCEYLQISRRTLNRLLDNGEIPSTKLGQAKSAPIRIPRDALLQALGLGPGRNEKRRDEAAAERERLELLSM